jgi:FlaA1/EpsC-like NDP-sugar epimerase
MSLTTARKVAVDLVDQATRSVVPKPVRGWVLRHRYRVQAMADAIAWVVALAIACWLRFEFDVSRIPVPSLLLFGALATLLQTVSGIVTGLYVGRWRLASFEAAAALARSVSITTIALFVVDLYLVDGSSLPRSAVLAAGPLALVLLGGMRYVARALADRRRRPRGERAERLVVFGAGEAGFQIVSALLHDPSSPYLPVALLDDDPGKRKLRLLGVPVAGPHSSLCSVARQYDAKAVLIAIPSAGPDVIREVSARAAECELSVKVLPPVAELFGGVTVDDIRPLTEADLLGRHQVETDVASIAGYLTGKRVLVTGAGGSIGAELCRQIDRFAPAELIMLDRDESALHAVQLSIEGRALLDTPNVVLGDIRDAESVRAVFRERRPEVVFHAAALKHLPMLEQYPGEAVKTNVWGTLAVLEAAQAAGVERFVNISTDKAADPTSVLGYSKRIAERLTAHVAAEASGTYLSVRFGNVLGSRGSVLTTFRAQVDAGGPLTVTDPDVTRYFMTIEEAVQLVIQAGAIGRDGEALVLDMGAPVRILDVAQRLAAESPHEVEIVLTGLRPGEKRVEALFASDEPDDRPIHPLISHVPVPPLDPLEVRALDTVSVDVARRELGGLCRVTPARTLS